LVDYRASVRGFASTGGRRSSLHRQNFFETPYGRRQWVSVWADRRVSWQPVERLLLRSYRLVALKRMIASLDTASPRNRRAAGSVKKK
jgi:hypothetical protein